MLGRSGWSRAARSIHTRILLSYIALIVLSGGLCTIAIHEVLVIRLESRIAEAVQQEFQEINRLVADGRDPRTGAAFTSVQAVFDVYFRRNVPSQRGGAARLRRRPAAPRRTEPVPDRPAARARPCRSSPPRRGRTRWRTAGRRSTGSTPTAARRTTAILPVRVGASTGTFVVTILPVTQRQEIADLQTYGVARGPRRRGARLGVCLAGHRPGARPGAAAHRDRPADLAVRPDPADPGRPAATRPPRWPSPSTRCSTGWRRSSAGSGSSSSTRVTNCAVR